MSDKAEHVRTQNQTRDHTCHAEGCNLQMPPAMFMCKRHWFMVPSTLRSMIWSLYEIGQEVDGTPSKQYVKIAMAAIKEVAKAEGCR